MRRRGGVRQATIVKARNLHGTPWRISDRYKREGGCVIPGEICMGARRPCATGIERCREARAEVSRGHSRRSLGRRAEH